MFEAFCKDKLAPLMLRIGLGALGLWHGFTKITANGGMTWHPGLSVGWQLAIAWAEFAAGLAILLGFRCRIAALVLVALSTALFLEWHQWNVLRLPVRTLEMPLLLLFAGVALAFLGAGDLSLPGGAASGKSGAARPVKTRKAA